MTQFALKQKYIFLNQFFSISLCHPVFLDIAYAKFFFLPLLSHENLSSKWTNSIAYNNKLWRLKGSLMLPSLYVKQVIVRVKTHAS